MATVRLHDVTKIFRPGLLSGKPGVEQAVPGGPVIALDRVNLTVLNGQIMVVIGPSGCGKSTLLRVVAGLDQDYTGQVLYDGQDMGQIPPKDRYIGMVFQNYALYPHFRGRGNLAFYFRLHRVSDAETEERIRITSEIMGLGFNELLPRKPGTLSGGQQQRVAIARAIVRNPRLFLFDEPLSSLDAKLRSQTRSEIKRLLRRFEITTLYVTHDQTEAMALADRIAIMRAGKIEQVGSYQTLRQSPVNSFVAGFLGHPPMNLMAGEVTANGELRLGPVGLALPPAVRSRVKVGQAVSLGIRPEAARLVRGEQAEPAGLRLQGMIEVIEPDFAHHSQLLHLRSGSLTYAVTASLDCPVEPGEMGEVIFPDEELYFFDRASEARIV